MHRAGSEGHIPSCFSVVEILAVLYQEILKHRSQDPGWDTRDYLILRRGHTSAVLYADLRNAGFIPERDLLRFANFDSPLGDHPDRNKAPGVEASAGPRGKNYNLQTGPQLNNAPDGA